MLNQIWAIFAKSKGEKSALTKTFFAHSLLKNNIFVKFQVNQVEADGKVNRPIIFGQFLQSPRAITPQLHFLSG